MQNTNKERHISSLQAKRGQMMVEAVVALSMLAMGIVGIFTLLSSSYRFNRVSTHEYIAANLAAEGIEIIRNIVDKNVMNLIGFNDDLISCENGCSVQYDSIAVGSVQDNFLNFNPTLGLYLYDTAFENTVFKRNLILKNEPVIGPNRIEVISTVSWKDRGLTYSVVLEDHLYNWRQ